MRALDAEQLALSRKRFLATGGAGAIAALVAGCGGASQTTTPGGSNANTAAGLGTDKFGKGDVGIAGYALTLEYLESDFYAKAIASGALSARTLALFRRFQVDERQHVAALEGAIKGLGGQLPPKLSGQFQLSDEASVLRIASTLENVGADAYLEQIAHVSSSTLRASAISIHTVEGRHAATVNSLLGTDIAPDGAFASPAYASDVLEQINAFVAPGAG